MGGTQGDGPKGILYGKSGSEGGIDRKCPRMRSGGEEKQRVLNEFSFFLAY